MMMAFPSGRALAFFLSIIASSRGETKIAFDTSDSLDGVGNSLSNTTHDIPMIQEEQPDELLRTTYSVIVAAQRAHPAGHFLDRARVEAYGGSGVAAVQYASANDAEKIPYKPGMEPFHTGHPTGVDKRIRIVQVNVGKNTNILEPMSSNKLSHLEASCKDPTETTILIITDETCRAEIDFWSAVCGSNEIQVFLGYPSSNPSPEEAPRHAYIPLAPRDDTFPFIKRSRQIQTPASSRELLFNLQVSARTSPRRGEVIDIATDYAAQRAEVKVHLNGENLKGYQWQRLLLRSKFTICPGGHSPETHRMFEALELGSIPIVSKLDYLDPPFSYDGRSHPCGDGPAAWNTVAASPFAQAVSVESWEELPQLLDELMEMSDDAIDQLQVECEQWYEALMRGTYASLLNVSSFQKFWPQEGPIMPIDLLESSWH